MGTTTLKRSRQREAILTNLMNRCDHPTADMIYIDIRKEIPNISLGTVYRNLSLLADKGDILRITTNGKAERFDGKTNDHYHFICQNCGEVTDLPLEHMEDVNQAAQKVFGGKITGHETIFHGICSDCLK
ncbi:MAG: transcriptional repressor [Lachnospiraceae bacterium]|nr:transcriptional repressor [Lachnospiraceae bacterium]